MLWFAIWRAKWWLTAAGAVALGAILVRWFGLAPWKAVAIVAPTAIARARPAGASRARLHRRRASAWRW